MTATAAFLLLLSAEAPVTSASEMIEHHSWEMPQSLFYTAARASGYWYCDRRLKPPQAKRFNRLYGSRVIRLSTLIAERDGLGWKPDDIITTPCSRENARERAKSLKDFGVKLAEFEVEYLPMSER